MSRGPGKGWRGESLRHSLAARGIPSTVHVRRHIESAELSDAQLVARVKAMYPKVDKQALYGRFVQQRGLRPGIDAKEFNEIYDYVRPDMYVEERNVDFKPTHRNKGNGLLTMIWDDERGVHHYIDENGSIGSNPPFMKTEDYYDTLER